MMKYKYKLSSVGCSSARTGNCEVCNKYVSDVFIQTKLKQFFYEGKERFSHVSGTFGHKECLEGIQN